MADTKFRFYVTQFEGKIFFEDKTEYSCVINDVTYERNEIALAIMYSIDERVNFNAVLANDYTAELGYIANDVIDLSIQIIKIHESRAYNVNEVTFKDGYFYASLISNNLDIPSESNQNWILLTESNAVAYLTQNDGLGYYLKKIATYHSVPDNTIFDVNKISKTKYQFINYNFDYYVVNKKVLYDWENKLVEEVSDDFEIIEDGVYKLQILYSVDDSGKGTEPDDESALLETFIPIIRIDDIECCYKKMIQTLYCKDSTFCVDGDCFSERESIYKINDIQNIYFTLIVAMNVSRLDFYNVLGSEDSVDYYVQEIGRLVKMIRLMVDECKNCCNE